MNLKIKDFKKFIRSIIMMLGVIIFISMFISSKSFSHADTNFKIIYVSTGDTLWSIAKEEKETNSYFESKDIREIVNDIKKANNLNNSYLSNNQKLVIPYI